jgi:hypothetical protein
MSTNEAEATPPTRRTIRTKVVGVTSSNEGGDSRQRIIQKHCRPGMTLEAIPEPDNEHDPNAIGIWVPTRRFWFFPRRFQIGYLRADLAEELAAELRNGWAMQVQVLDVTGGGSKTQGVNIEVTLGKGS